jgi:hypothetical protein
MPTTDSADSAEFELYDLRVEVVGPPDRTIYCARNWAIILNCMAKC